MSETVKLHAADGHAFHAYVASPKTTPKAAIVVVQEIFGVNHHIRSIADRFAKEGYLAIAPALFDRYQPGFEVGYDGAGMQQAMTILPKLNKEWIAADTLATVVYARDEYKTKVAVVGFCVGGSVAWTAAAHLPISAAVGYYGGLIVQSKDLPLKAPILLHFGAKDEHIPMSDVEQIKAAHPEVPVFVYEGADHGFNCDERSSYHPAAAAEAWVRTTVFLEAQLNDQPHTIN